MKKTLYLLLLLLLASSTARPQGNNAVSISIIRGTCYSSKIADYCSDNNASMLKVILVNQDLREASIPVQLYMSVSLFGKETYLSTKSPNPSRIITLNSGSQLILTGKELDCIFSPQNLTGGYQNFKDGDNVIKIYARDIRTGKVVSNTASITLKSLVIAPPKLVEPDNGIVIETDNPFLLFSWKGDNGGGKIASKNNYVYRFYLWRQITGDPNVDAQVNRQPDYSFDNIKDERYQMPLMQYPFEIGKKYAWRVEARDPLGCATFINDGWSEVRSFTYKHLPVPVTGLTHTIKQTTRRATVTWDAAEGHTKYYIEYYNPQTQKTISNTTAEPRYELAAAPDSEYKILFRVKAQCWGDDSRTSDWTPWDTIKYSARQRVESEYECGHKFPHVDITNFDLKTDFEEGDIVSEANGSSNYEIINYTAEPDGTLRGQFYLVMDAWGGAKIACEFWDTKINTDNVVITTRYRSIDLPGYVANPDEIQRYVKSLWLDANSVATSSKIRDTIVIKEKFDYLYTAADGTLYAVVVNSDGTTTETEVHTNKNTSQCLITDGQGDSLVISQNGQPMGIQEYRATGGNKALLKEYHRKSDSLAQWQINFTKYDAQTYAFDRIGSGNHGIFNTDLYYPKSGSYDFRYKSVESGKTDRVVVDFGSYSEKDSVIFKDKYGVKLKVVDGNILAFTGVSTADTNFIYAYRGDKKIGKLFLNTYQKKTYKVVLISVNGAKLPNVKDLENYLNKVYRQCADSFKIETRDLQVTGIENFTHGGTKVAGSVWNASQKAVLEAFGEKYEDNTAYLFFIPKAETGGVAGYMPRYYPYGFIYPGAANRTIAHELGHGIAGLEHPFPESQVSGSTQNLMDYRDGTELWHFQWDMLQDPARKIFKWWQNEQGAENQEDLWNLAWIDTDLSDRNGFFITPSGNVIYLTNILKVAVLAQKDDGVGVGFNAITTAIYGFDNGTQRYVADITPIESGYYFNGFMKTPSESIQDYYVDVNRLTEQNSVNMDIPTEIKQAYYYLEPDTETAVGYFYPYEPKSYAWVPSGIENYRAEGKILESINTDYFDYHPQPEDITCKFEKYEGHQQVWMYNKREKMLYLIIGVPDDEKVYLSDKKTISMSEIKKFESRTITYDELVEDYGYIFNDNIYKRFVRNIIYNFELLDETCKKWNDIIDKYTVTHWDVSVSTNAGMGFVNLENVKYFGFGMDSQNVALYGDFKTMFRWMEKSFDWNSIDEKLMLSIGNKLSESMGSDVKIEFVNEEEAPGSQIFGLDLSACITYSWDWGYDKLPDLFGHSRSIGIGIEELAGFNFGFDCNAEGKLVGIAAGVCLGAGSSIGFNYNYAKGIILHQTELPFLTYHILTGKYDLTTEYYVGFRAENGMVVYYNGLWKIITEIPAAENNNNNSYVITQKAYERKKSSYQLD